MSKLSSKGKNIVERLFIDSGYVLNFSNRTFQTFVFDTINVDIYEDENYNNYSSKGNKLRQLISDENDYKVTKLLMELIDYLINMRLSNDEKLTKLEVKLIEDLNKEIDSLRLISSDIIKIEEEIDDRIEEISTRSARFTDMAEDEKLKELANLLEYLLKDKKKFKVLNFEKYTFDFIDDNDLTQFRKKLQIFRHSDKESIEERKKINNDEKIFLVNYGVLIVNYISIILKSIIL